MGEAMSHFDTMPFSEEKPGRLFAHVCPECKTWQVEYTEFVFLTEATFTVDGQGNLIPNLTACHQMVEDVVEEHYHHEHPLALAAFRATR